MALVLHGLMGSGRNWRTFARALSARLAAGGTPWRFALVDHVWHGRTFGDRTHREWRNPRVRDGVPNGACAVDLAASAVGDFAAHVRATHPHCRVAAVIGHSLGGKIALRHPREARRRERAAAAPDAVVVARLGPVRGGAPRR